MLFLNFECRHTTLPCYKQFQTTFQKIINLKVKRIFMNYLLKATKHKNCPCELCFYHVCMPKLCSMPDASLFECIQSNMHVVFNPDVYCSQSMDNPSKYVLVWRNTRYMHQNSSEKQRYALRQRDMWNQFFSRTTTDTKTQTIQIV